MAVLCYALGMAVCMMGCSSKEETTQPQQEVTQEQAGVQESETVPEAQTQVSLEQENAQVTQEQEQAEPQDMENPVLTMNVRDVTVELGMDINTILDQLGEADDYFAAKSCTGEGEDKSYTYGGISLYTYPGAGKDTIFIIELAGEETLASGLGVGSSRADIIATYGEEYMDDGMYLEYEYDDGATTLCFTMDGDIATLVEIYGAQP